MSLPVLGIIPARIGSSRLPRKPLHPLAGRPLIEWVWRGAVAMDLLDEVVVATDSEEVADVVRAFGGRAELTAAEHPSGTDRVAEVAERPEFAGYPVVLNVQGDEPFVRRGRCRPRWSACGAGDGRSARRRPRWPRREEWREPSVVKVVRGADGGALLFSRAPIPFRRDGEPGPEELASGLYLRHLGIYAYRREALLRWVALPRGRAGAHGEAGAAPPAGGGDEDRGGRGGGGRGGDRHPGGRRARGAHPGRDVLQNDLSRAARASA
jgi:3-deoxy-manno-octulosonate cytidylyltransferase (CMP-KDO synthetase)